MNSRQCREKKDRKTTQSLQSVYTTENTFLGEDAAWAERAAGTTQKDHKLAICTSVNHTDFQFSAAVHV